MARIAVFHEAHGFGGELDVGVVENNYWCVTAEFHGGALHVLAGHAREQLADGGGTGEGNFADHRMGYEVARNF